MNRFLCMSQPTVDHLAEELPKPETEAILLKPGAIETLKEEYKVHTDKALAALLGIDTSHLWRLKKGESVPGNAIMARLLRRGAQFDLMFDNFFVVSPPPEIPDEDEVHALAS